MGDKSSHKFRGYYKNKREFFSCSNPDFVFASANYKIEDPVQAKATAGFIPFFFLMRLLRAEMDPSVYSGKVSKSISFFIGI